MKIGFFTDGYLPQTNGVSTSVDVLARELRKKGHLVYIIAPQMPDYKDTDPFTYRLRSMPLSRNNNFRLALQLPEKNLVKILQIDFDIIHGHAGGPVSLLGMQIAKLRGIPYIATYHTLWNRYTHYILKGKVITPRMLEHASRLFGNKCDSLIAPSERVRKELLSYGVKRPIHVIPNGIELDRFKPDSNLTLRKKLGFPADSKLLLFVGRLGKEKSIDFLFNAFSKIVKKEENVKLLVVGDGPDSESLKKLAITLEIENKVHFLGSTPHDEISEIYKNSDIFVFSSKTETQGMVLIEAMACGLPVVVVDDLAYKNVVEDKVNGLISKFDTDEFSEKVLQIIKNDSLKEKLSKGARNSTKKFAIENTASKFESLYTSLIQKNDQTRAKRISIRFYRTLNNLLTA